MKVYKDSVSYGEEEQLEFTQVPIKSLDDFNHMYESIVEQHQRENKSIKLETLERLVGNLSDELKKEVFDSIDITDENHKTLMKMYIEFTEFEKMDEQEKLHSISTDGSILDDICSLLDGENEYYKHEFCAKVLSNLYRNAQSFDEKDSFDLLYLFKGVAKYVLQNNIDFETLKVDCSIFQDDRVARLSSLSQDGAYKHLTSIHQEEDDFRTLRLANEDDREYIKDWFNGISEDEPIEIDDDERLAFAQTNEGTQTLLGLDDGYFEDANKVINIDSIREREQKNINSEMIAKKIKETMTIVTHFGDDLDNKSAIYAIQKWAEENGVIIEGEKIEILRVPAGQTKNGYLNIDTGGHRGSFINDDGETIVIDGDPKNGIKSASEAVSRLEIYVPKQIVELADTRPNKVSSLDSRSGLALVRYLSGEQTFKLAEAMLLDKQLTDEQIKEFGLVEAHKKQQEIIDNACRKIEQYTRETSNGEKIVLAPEQIIAGSNIAYEMGINYYVSASTHLDNEKMPDGVTFAITCKPGAKLPDSILEYGKELVEKYRIDENSSGVFVNPNGQMIVAGGFKNPTFKIEGKSVEEMLEEIQNVFERKEISKANNREISIEAIKTTISDEKESEVKGFGQIVTDAQKEENDQIKQK